MVKTIAVDKALKLDALFIDTRTPKEFEECHIPGAYNIPILSDEERHIVGYMYKQVDKDKAIDKGHEIYEKKKSKIISDIQMLIEKTPAEHIVVYCWRGGMRSKVITQLLNENGIEALQLEGGHKEYRKYVRDSLATYKFKPKLIVLYGLTGSGKTELIQRINRPKIDLEGHAQHRSSLLGAVGLKPTTQKYFESLIFDNLEKINDEKLVFIEGESRKVGDRVIPEFLFNAMKNNCINVRVNCDIKNRVKRIVPEYFDSDEKVAQVRKVVSNMRQLLSNKVVDELLSFLDKKDYDKVTEILLLKYYDEKYSHTVDNVNYDYEIENNEIKKGIKQLQDIYLSQ